MASANDLTLNLGSDIANAAIIKASLKKSIQSSLDETEKITHYMNNAENCLRSLPDVEAGLRAILAQTTQTASTIAQLKIKLKAITIKMTQIFETHECNISNAWKAWREAVTDIVGAGEARDAHQRILEKIGCIKKDVLSEEDAVRVSGAHSLLQTWQNLEVDKSLVRARGVVQAKLMASPKELIEHKEAWEYGYGRLEDVVADVEEALAVSENGIL